MRETEKMEKTAKVRILVELIRCICEDGMGLNIHLQRRWIFVVEEMGGALE